jgi:hypothetical protein
LFHKLTRLLKARWRIRGILTPAVRANKLAPSCAFPLEQRVELIYGYLSGFKNMRECALFYRAVRWNSNFQKRFSRPLLQSDVATPLSDNDKTSALERPDNSVER